MNIQPPSHPALFLDRDGVINREAGYITNTNGIEFMEHIFELCRFFKDQSYKIVVITNQSGIGRKIIENNEYIEINATILKKFEEELCQIDLILTSTVDPTDKSMSDEEKFLRKPNPGMILRAQSELNLDISKSILIGDNLTDMRAGYEAGVPNLILIKNPVINGTFFECFPDLKSCTVRLKHLFDLNLN